MKSFAAGAILLTAQAYAENFAVLLAGSATYENYRHQGDVAGTH
jgi:glycosylphosphatidylinositol transamidase (GPIT) subunit GPI8